MEPATGHPLRGCAGAHRAMVCCLDRPLCDRRKRSAHVCGRGTRQWPDEVQVSPAQVHSSCVLRPRPMPFSAGDAVETRLRQSPDGSSHGLLHAASLLPHSWQALQRVEACVLQVPCGAVRVRVLRLQVCLESGWYSWLFPLFSVFLLPFLYAELRLCTRLVVP